MHRELALFMMLGCGGSSEPQFKPVQTPEPPTRSAPVTIAPDAVAVAQDAVEVARDAVAAACPITLGADPTFAIMWPSCEIDGPLYNHGARCRDKRYCMRPCRTEIRQLGALEWSMTYTYDSDGRLLTQTVKDG